MEELRTKVEVEKQVLIQLMDTFNEELMQLEHRDDPRSQGMKQLVRGRMDGLRIGISSIEGIQRKLEEMSRPAK